MISGEPFLKPVENPLVGRYAPRIGTARWQAAEREVPHPDRLDHTGPEGAEQRA